MRNDMSKVIVERPRVGGGLTKKRTRPVDPDLLVSKEGMRAPHVRYHGGKELNENLAPLRRFLGKQVGRMWNDVYSEISENLKVSSTVQQHVRDHVNDFVAVRTSIRNGEIWIQNYRLQKLEDSRVMFYVDPASGILKVNPHRQEWIAKRKKSGAEWHIKNAERIKEIASGTMIRKVDGIWYIGTLADVPAPIIKSYLRADGTENTYRTGGTAYDVLLQKTVEHPDRAFYKRDAVEKYCISKRQLNRKELQKYGLKND